MSIGCERGYRIHVCFLENNSYIGSSSTAYYEYSQILSENPDFQVSVISSSIEGGSTRKSIRTSRHGNVLLLEIPVRTFSKKNILASSYFGYMAILAVKKLKREYGLDIVQMKSFPHTGIFMDMPIEGLRTIADIRSLPTSSNFSRLVSKPMYRLQSSYHDRVLALHESMLIDAGIPDEIGRVVTLGANMKSFGKSNNQGSIGRGEYGIKENEILLVYIGAITKSRGIETLLKSFELLSEKVSNVHLLLIGKAEDLLLKAIEKYREKGVAMTNAGVVPFEEIPAYLNMCDIGLAYVPNNRIFRDQPPLKTAEYLASELCVVATDTIGNMQFIENEKNGILCSDGLVDFTENLLRVCTNKELRKKLADVARNSVQKYDYHTIVKEQLMPVYGELLP